MRRAPSRINAFGASDKELVTAPGTANTSLPTCDAKSAVLRVPLDATPSTMTTPIESPAMSLLRAGKRNGSAGTPGGYSLTSVPRTSISRNNERLVAG